MSDHSRSVLIGLLLVVLTVAAYESVRFHGFIDLDDPVYVSQNDEVKKGLTRPGLHWAWTTLHAGYWQPLTWMSLQLDAQLFGPHAAGFHRTNLVLHAMNAVLLFAVLRVMTGAAWRSGLVAALFAVHPLHVESVAWVAERKDVLSTFFWMLTMGTYARYAQRPSMGRYLPVVAALVLGLMAKPMLVTLPFVLLLLDYWPMRRLQVGQAEEADLPRFVPAAAGRLVVEKLPLLALAVGFGMLTVFAQGRTEAVVSLEMIPFERRLAMALVGYMDYLRTTVWPVGLSLFYPYPLQPYSWERPAGAAALLAILTAAALALSRRLPYVPVGWFWFLGTMAPVCGLMQSGEQARADRFAYIPNIGLYLIAAWALGDLATRWRSALVPAAAALLAVAACLVLTREQVACWRNARSLWEHGVAVDANNYHAHYSLGMALVQEGDVDNGVKHLYKVLEIGYDALPVRKSLGTVLLNHGRAAEALTHLNEALRHNPEAPDTLNAMGAAYLQDGQPEAAVPYLQKALVLRSDFVGARLNLAQALQRLNRLADAEMLLRDLLVRDPNQAEGLNQLGLVLGQQGRWPEAVACFRRAVDLQPTVVRYQDNLAHALGQTDQFEADRIPSQS